MSDKQPLSIFDRYEHQPILRALIQLVPGGFGSAIDAALMTHINNMRETRMRMFFDTLVDKGVILTADMINNDEFLHAYFSTMRAVLNTNRQEKIQLFAFMFSRLISNIPAANSEEIYNEYDEFLQILDDLSLREFKILTILHQHELTSQQNYQLNDLQRINLYWDKFLLAIEKECGLTKDDITAVLSRLNRSGLYLTITGAYIDYSGDQGYLTPLFLRFINLLGLCA